MLAEFQQKKTELCIGRGKGEKNNKLSKAALQFDPRLHLEIRIHLTESQYGAIRIYLYS